MSETPGGGGGPGPTAPADDPWAVFGYLVAGVLFYGAIGWLVSLWLHATYWIPIGILVGAGLGMFMVFHRYRFTSSDAEIDVRQHSLRSPELGRTAPPARDDRGETS